MDSDDDMHAASDVESVQDDDCDDALDAGDEYVESDSDDFTLRHQQKSYIVLSEDDIRQRQEDDITTLCAVLSISRVEAGILLRHYNWCVTEVQDKWFAEEETIRQAVGLLRNPVVDISNATELTCSICFEASPKDDMYAAACGHPFCSLCWTGYISTSINSGPGCLMLRCPDPCCAAAVGQDMIDALVSENDRNKHARYLLRSYIEDNKKTKWCPAPGCDFAVDFVVGSDSNDVICRCSYGFCWNCSEEAHRPVDCETVSKWIIKNSAESENMNWILANSKPCPKCKRSIEKNHGCMHMTCTPPCKFEFCWLCLDSWSTHGERTGGFYACNTYETAKLKGVYDEAEKRRERAKNSLEKYTHYYERWATNQKSRQKAVADLQQLQNVNLEKLSGIHNEPESQLKFLVEAWTQIVECRRVLKWTYAYGYYIREDEYAKKQFFEYSQGEAEACLERLHQCAEKELQVFLDAEGPSNEFKKYREKLAGLTSVTRNHFEKLVLALQNDLSDVHSHGGGRGDNLDYWACDQCAYWNTNSATACRMCNQGT